VLIKWVVVRVSDRAAFHQGQQGWATARRCAGFVGQCGGWSRADATVAHIIGGWTDGFSYRAFMAGAHDGIAAAQAGTYHGTEVRLFDHCRDTGAGMFAATGSAALLRLVHGHVRAERLDRFVHACQMWTPGPTVAPGLRGGAFARHGASEFLMVSRWRTVADHDRYFSVRTERSGASDDLTAIADELIDLEPSWTVP
jgi:hypothetical protein